MPQTVQFEGQTYQFPDDATDDEIAASLSGEATAAPVAEQPGMRLSHTVPFVAQEAARGLGEMALTPAELYALAQNAGLGAVDTASQALGGPEISYRAKSPTETMGRLASGAIEALGGEVLEPETGMESLLGNVARFGVQGLGGGLGMARAATSRFPQGVKAVKQSFGDRMLAPYASAPKASIATETAAGAGQGTGAEFAERKEMGLFGTLMSQLAGGTLGGVGTAAVTAPKRTLHFLGSLFNDPEVAVHPVTGEPVSRRVVDRARRVVDENATDRATAADTYRTRVGEARQFNEPIPPPGSGSDDIGMNALEAGARVRNSPRFQEADQRLMDAAQENVTSLRDPGADQSVATRYAQQRPDELAAARDAAALPLLRQAEESGATVDATPVAALIDEKLATAKRDPVRNALTDARRKLNAPGSDELDTSVSGLYETRKAINDIIEGRSDTPTGRFAKKELIEVRDALDAAINDAVPEFGQYLSSFRQGSRALDVFDESKSVAKLLADDPRNVAKSILSGQDYASATKIREVNSVLKNDPGAMKAWKAAVAEVMVDKVTGTNTAMTHGAAEGPVRIAQLQKTFKQHENALAEVFNPAEMQQLRRAHKMLEPLGNRARHATVGSPTAENQQFQNMVEASILAYTGNAITTGMIMKRIRTVIGLFPGLKEKTLDQKVMRLIDRMHFDPDLALHIMTGEIPPPNIRQSFKPQIGIAGAEGVRQFTAEGDDQP